MLKTKKKNPNQLYNGKSDHDFSRCTDSNTFLLMYSNILLSLIDDDQILCVFPFCSCVFML